MNEGLIKENKEKLIKEQEKLHKLLRNRGEFEGKGEFPGDYKPEFPSFGDQPDENAGEVADYDTRLGVTRDLEEKLKNVEQALKRIKEGTYGKCVKGDEIEEERLRAIPEADTCIKHSK